MPRYASFCFLKTLLQSVMAAVLDPELQVPSEETFELRCGVDALTGDSKFPALRESTVQNKSLNHDSTSKRTTLVVEIIHGVHQQSRNHKFEVQGTVNPMSPLALNTSFAIQTSHVSSGHSFLVETIVSGEYDFEKLNLEDLVPTSDAQHLSKTPAKFRMRHGDYFVLGFKRRYWFHAFVECR